jgi:hypothetical protein
VTETARTRPSFGDRYGRLRVLRSVGDGERVLVFCVCQKSFAIAIEELLSGATTSCPRCAPLLPEQRNALREEVTR